MQTDACYADPGFVSDKYSLITETCAEIQIAKKNFTQSTFHIEDTGMTVTSYEACYARTRGFQSDMRSFEFSTEKFEAEALAKEEFKGSCNQTDLMNYLGQSNAADYSDGYGHCITDDADFPYLYKSYFENGNEDLTSCQVQCEGYSDNCYGVEWYEEGLQGEEEKRCWLLLLTVENEGENCSFCGGGSCPYCGGGFCCKYGVVENGCDGYMGIEEEDYVCTAAPYTPTLQGDGDTHAVCYTKHPSYATTWVSLYILVSNLFSKFVFTNFWTSYFHYLDPMARYGGKIEVLDPMEQFVAEDIVDFLRRKAILPMYIWLGFSFMVLIGIFLSFLYCDILPLGVTMCLV
eukprot:UN33453